MRVKFGLTRTPQMGCQAAFWPKAITSGEMIEMMRSITKLFINLRRQRIRSCAPQPSLAFHCQSKHLRLQLVQG